MQTFGRHFLMELTGCNPDIIGDLERVKQLMLEAAVRANATVVTSAFHRFYPQGVSGVVVIEESHLSLHSWPEYGYVALDIYTCGEDTQPEQACEYLAQEFESQEKATLSVERGLPTPYGSYGYRINPAQSVVERRVLVAQN